MTSSFDASRASMGDVARARVLDLLEQQRRRICDLSARVAAGQRTLERCAVSLAWRSPARLEFDSRLGTLQRNLARTSGALATALTECDRARDLLRSALAAADDSGTAGERAFIGYPAGATRR